MSIDPGQERPLDESDYAAYERETHGICFHCKAPVCRRADCTCGLPKGVDVADGGYDVCPGPGCIEQTVADSAVDEEDITSPARRDADRGDGYEAQMLRAFRGMAVRP